MNNKALDILRYEKPIIELAKTKNTNRNYVARPNHSQRVAVPYTWAIQTKVNGTMTQTRTQPAEPFLLFITNRLNIFINLLKV